MDEKHLEPKYNASIFLSSVNISFKNMYTNWGFNSLDGQFLII